MGENTIWSAVRLEEAFGGGLQARHCLLHGIVNYPASEPAAWAQYNGLAKSTRSSYWSSITTAMKCLGPLRLCDPTSIIAYCRSRVITGKWSSHNAPKFLGRLIAAMKWLHLTIPQFDDIGTSKRLLKKALTRERPSQGVQHRPAIPWTEFQVAIQSLGRPKHSERKSGGGDGLAQAALWMGYLGMMRPNEIFNLRIAELKWAKVQGRSEWTVDLRISDKTHVSRNRHIHLVTEEWQNIAKELRAWCQHNLSRGRGNDQVFSKRIRSQVKNALKVAGQRFTLGCLRPGGHMFWLEAGLPEQVIHKQGGWAPGSNIPSRHYTSLTKPISQMMTRALQFRCQGGPESVLNVKTIRRWAGRSTHAALLGENRRFGHNTRAR